MVVLVLVRRLGFRGLLRAHYADLPRLAHMRAMAAFAPALTPMLATPPARVFAATNMLVCVLLLLHFCSELLFPLCSGTQPPKSTPVWLAKWPSKGSRLLYAAH